MVDAQGQVTQGVPPVRISHAPVNDQLAQEHTLEGCQLYWQAGTTRSPTQALRHILAYALDKLPEVPRNSWFLQLLEVASIEHLPGTTKPRRYKVTLCHPEACAVMEELQQLRIELAVPDAQTRQMHTSYISLGYSADQDARAQATRQGLQHALGTTALQEPTLALHRGHMLSMVRRLLQAVDEYVGGSAGDDEGVVNVWLYNMCTGETVAACDVGENNVLQILVTGRGTPLSKLDDDALLTLTRGGRGGLRLLLPCCDPRSLYLLVRAAAGGLRVPVDGADQVLSSPPAALQPGLQGPAVAGLQHGQRAACRSRRPGRCTCS